MAPGVIFAAVGVGLLFLLSKKKKAFDGQGVEPGAPPTEIGPQPMPPVDATPPDDTGLPPFQPSPPYGRQPPPRRGAPSYGPAPAPAPYPAPPSYPTTAPPPGVVENWRRATQDDVNRDSMLPRYMELLHSGRPIGSEVRVNQNGRPWKLRLVSHATDPSLTTQPRDVRGWILVGPMRQPVAVPTPTAPPAYPPPGGHAAYPPPRVAPHPPAYPATYPPSHPGMYPPPPPAAHGAPPGYPATYPPPHIMPGFPQPHPGGFYPPPQPAPGPLPTGLPNAPPPMHHGPAYPTPGHGPTLAFGAPLPTPAPGAPGVAHAPAPGPTTDCKNWMPATDADVKRDGVATLFHSMLGMPDRSEKSPEQHNGRWWKFKVVTKASDPTFSFGPGVTKSVRGWICADGGAAAASGSSGAIIGYMPAHNVGRLPDGQYTVFTHESGTGLQPLVSGTAQQVGAAYEQWKARGGDPNATVLVQQQ